MRYFATLSVLMMGFAFTFAAGCETTPKTSASQTAMNETEPIETSSATLIVHGMGCPLCANNVDSQLLAVQGVDRVNVNMGTGEVKVHLSDTDRPSRAQLARAIDRSGFTLVSIETP